MKNQNNLNQEPIIMTQSAYNKLLEVIKTYEDKKRDILEHLSEKYIDFGDKTSGETYLNHELEIVNIFIDDTKKRLSKANIVEENLDDEFVDTNSFIYTIVNDGTKVSNAVYHLYEINDCIDILLHEDDDVVYTSLESPVGRALYGKTVGTQVNVKLPNGKKIEITIENIEKILTR